MHQQVPSLPIRIAAIDIGSNAIRLVIAEPSQLGFHILKKVRAPIRLGKDVFSRGEIGKSIWNEASRAFREFADLLRSYQVSKVKAVATSALREARNRNAFVDLISVETGIFIEIVDGVREAQLIHTAVTKELHLDKYRALLIDIGGGSVELTISDNGSMISTHSFPFGTVRTINQLKKRKLRESALQSLIAEYLEPLAHFLQSQHITKFDFAIGTGGNLEALAKLKPLLLNQDSRTMLSLKDVNEILQRLTLIPTKQRVRNLNMRPDRADVILPATLVVQMILQLANIQKLLIPGVGLKDGILWSLRQGLRSPSAPKTTLIRRNRVSPLESSPRTNKSRRSSLSLKKIG
jgi:exopolyphosphatase/guanosine-5'-triphosphate,3'-diphosphate pyrophosphatase